MKWTCTKFRGRGLKVIISSFVFAATQAAFADVLESQQVNNISGLGLDQSEPVIVATPTGNIIAAWIDERNGTADIRVGLYDSNGLSLSPSFQVNQDDVRGIDEEAPSVAVDGSGNFVVVWQDNRTGDMEIYARRYDAMGNPLGASFTVNEGGIGTDQSEPDVACDAAGNFLVVWQVFSTGYFVFGRHFDNLGTPTGDSFQINVPGEFSLATLPAVAMSPSGAFTVAWVDADVYFTEIFSRAYAPDTTPLTDPIWISDDGTDSDHGQPDVAMSSDDHAVITWADGRDEFSNGIFAQLIGAGGLPVGVNFRIDENQAGTYNMNPVIAMSPAGDFIISWHDYINSLRTILGQWLDAAGNPIGTNEIIAQPTSSSTAYTAAAVAHDHLGRTVFAWQSDHYSAPEVHDILMRRYDINHQPVSDEEVLNDDVDACNQTYPGVAVDGSGASIVVWEDMRNGNEDIFMRRFDAQCNPIGPELLVNDDGTDVHNRNAQVAMNDAGTAVVGWVDGRVTFSDIFIQRYNASGTPLGTNTHVNESAEGSQYGVELAVAPDDSFIVLWMDSIIDSYDVFIQRYDDNGMPLGNNVRVNTDPPYRTQTSGDLGMDAAGNFVVIWSQNDGVGFGYNIYGQLFDVAGNRIGTNYILNDGSGGLVTRRESTVAMAPDGSFTVTWTDYRHDEPAIYARRFDAAGSPLSADFQVNDDGNSFNHEDPSIAADSMGNITIVWTDYRQGYPTLFSQQYDASGMPIGANEPIGTDLDPSIQMWSRTAYGDDRLFIAWEGNHIPGQGYDIWLASTPDSACPADLTGDDQVNIDDIFAILGLWGVCPDPCPPYCTGDLTEDCSVNIDDIFAVLGEWGPCE